MDQMVLQTQEWLNATYGSETGYNKVTEDGKTGWSTMYALTRALQLELGITATADNFGAGTASAYKAWCEMELGNCPTDKKGQNIVQIFQGACWCKGYNPGGFNGTFGASCQSAAMQLQTDAGLPAKDGKVYDYVFKAFLTMDAYVLTSGGDTRVREIQQALNYSYYKTAGVQPCDGIYQRSTQKAIVYGIQTEEGIAAENQTGSVGDATKAKLPLLSTGSTGNFVKLLQYLLYVNNYDPGAFDGQFYSGVKAVVMEFQEFTLLGADGMVGTQTWLSLLLSTGDSSRKGTACDCITEVTAARGAALVAAGYKTVGRYLVNVSGGINKKIQSGELETIHNAGLTVFPIFQRSGDAVSSFNYSQGVLDAQEAYTAALNYGFKEGTTIYFAVDYDALGTDITNYIIPHFSGINAQMNSLGNRYKIGVYGTRNVCIQVSNAGYAETSFVSGMSTGYSGNLGYPLPSNWAFDQISTISVGSGDGYIEIDNDMKSGKYDGESSVADTSDVVDTAFYSTFLKLALILGRITPLPDFVWEAPIYFYDNKFFKASVIFSKTLVEMSDGALRTEVKNGELSASYHESVDTVLGKMKLEHSADFKEMMNSLALSLGNCYFYTKIEVNGEWTSTSITFNLADYVSDGEILGDFSITLKIQVRNTKSDDGDDVGDDSSAAQILTAAAITAAALKIGWPAIPAIGAAMKVKRAGYAASAAISTWLTIRDYLEDCNDAIEDSD